MSLSNTADGKNMQIHGAAESQGNVDDSEIIIMNLAKELSIDLQPSVVQRAHRLGKKKSGANAKPQPAIVRFTSYKKPAEIIKVVSKLKSTLSYKDAFIVEDLTSLKTKLYVILHQTR